MTCWSPAGRGMPGVRADYERVLRQRTALLKSAKARGGVPPGALEVWDDHLVAAGAELTAGRLRLVSELEAAGRRLLQRGVRHRAGHRPAVPDVGQPRRPRQPGDGRCRRPDWRPSRAGARAGPDKLAVLLREALAARRRAELERGVCLVGPHRDELELQDRRPARARLRQPRRVVVAGAGAAAGRLPAAARRAARTRC